MVSVWENTSYHSKLKRQSLNDKQKQLLLKLISYQFNCGQFDVKLLFSVQKKIHLLLFNLIKTDLVQIDDQTIHQHFQDNMSPNFPFL